MSIESILISGPMYLVATKLLIFCLSYRDATFCTKISELICYASYSLNLLWFRVDYVKTFLLPYNENHEILFKLYSYTCI